MADRQRSPIGEGFDWAARITTIGCEMVLPGVVGYWLGERWGLRYLAIVGFIFGFVLGFWHLMAMTRPRD